LNSFEFAQPFLDDSSRQFRTGAQSGGAGWARGVSQQLAVLGERAITVTPHEKVFFTKEHHHRNTGPTTDLEGLLKLGIVVSILVTNLQQWIVCLEMVEDRALFDTVATPAASQAKHTLSTRETLQERLLLWGQRDRGMESIPAITLLRRSVAIQEIVVGVGLVK